jgi:hypothetical protein
MLDGSMNIHDLLYGNRLLVHVIEERLSNELDGAQRDDLENIFEKMRQLGTPRAMGHYSPMFAELYRTDRRMEKRIVRDRDVGVVSDDEE